MRQAKLFHAVACGFLAGTALLGLACDESTGKRELIITDPAIAPSTTKTLCEKDDRNTGVLEGIQITLTVSALGFSDGDTVLISYDGAEPDKALGQLVRNEAVTFMDLTIHQGLHSVQAVSTDGKIKSETIQFKVNASEPTLDFVGLSTTKPLGRNDDLDLGTAKVLDVDIEVLTSLENGDMVELFLTAPDAATGTSQGKQAISNRRAVFPRIKFDKSGKWTLEVRTVDTCMNGSSTLELQAVVEEAISCEITFSKAPLVRSGISALVFNAALDGSNAALFQTTATVTTEVGNTVDLYQNGSTQGTKVAASDGAGKGKVSYDLTLSEQAHSITANCTGAGGFTQPAKEASLFVDITPPSCAFTAPTDKDTLSPTDDVDTGDADVDFNVAVTVTGKDGDAESTAVDVFLTVGQNPESAALKTSVTTGKAQVMASVGVDANVAIRATTEDKAGNPCIPTPISVDVDVDGCNLLLKSPVATITSDANVDKDGLQADIVVETDADCAGREVTLSDCDVSGALKASATSATPPSVTFPKVTLCADASCQTQKVCKLEVTHPDGFTTSLTPAIKVDTLRPGTPVVVAKQVNRNTVRGEFTEPADNTTTAITSCVIKVSKTAITEQNYDALAVLSTFAGTTPGATHFVDLTNQRQGYTNLFFFAVQCVDAEGNKSPVGLSKEFALHFSKGRAFSQTRLPNQVSNDDPNFGTSSVSADLNKDGFRDLIVGAPLALLDSATTPVGVVFIYMGTANGPGTAPDFAIVGTDTDKDEYFGYGLVALDWNGDGTDDVAISGLRFANLEGRVFVFLGDPEVADPTKNKWNPTSSTVVLKDTDAAVTFLPDLAHAFYGGTTIVSLGSALASLDFDGDGRDDLLIGSQFANQFKGGAFVVFGGSTASTINLPPTASEAKVIGFSFNGAGTNFPSFGTYVHSLGRLGDTSGDTKDDVAIVPFDEYAHDTLDDTMCGLGLKHDPVKSEDRVFVFYGRDKPKDTDPAFLTIDMADADEELIAEADTDCVAGDGNDHLDFGLTMGSIEDQNDDGKREIVVTSQRFGADLGKVYVVPSGKSGTGKQTKNVGTDALFTITGTVPKEKFGLAIADANQGIGGDVDGDGKTDLVVTDIHNIYVWFGGAKLTGTLTTASREDDISLVDVYGQYILWFGDTNADTRTDLVYCDGGVYGTGGTCVFLQ